MVVEFFKVFLPDRSSHQLLIPPAFVSKHRECIRKHLVLEDFTGTQWRVDVERDGDHMFITNGWRDFVIDNHLKYGDFIVFTWHAKSLYIVRVFRKDSKLKGNGSADPPRSQSKRLDGISGEKRSEMLQATSLVGPDAPHCIISIKRYHHYTMRFPPQPLRTHAIELAKTVYLRDHNDKLWPMKLYYSPYGFSFDMPQSQPRTHEYDGMNDEKPKVMLHVKPFVRPKAPHCIVFIKKYNLYTLHIPPVPLREHRIKLGEYVCLRDHKGELWPVKIYFSGDARSVSLSAGWTDFRRHMNLECGDQCVFEFVLVKGNICKEIKVEVFHAIRN